MMVWERGRRERRTLDIVDDLLKRLDLAALVVVACKVDLVFGELVSAVESDEALGVDEPEAPLSLLLGKSLANEIGHELLSDTDGGGSSAKEEYTLVGERGSLLAGGVDEAAENDGAGSLDVVVKGEVLVTEVLEIEEGGLGREVLELDWRSS